MTRIHDGSPLPRLPSETSSETGVHDTGAPDRADEASASLPGDVGPPVRGALVSYDEFKERRQLRQRVLAAFASRSRTPAP
jgi:hypothetical protein